MEIFTQISFLHVSIHIYPIKYTMKLIIITINITLSVTNYLKIWLVLQLITFLLYTTSGPVLIKITPFPECNDLQETVTAVTNSEHQERSSIPHNSCKNMGLSEHSRRTTATSTTTTTTIKTLISKKN